LLILQTLTVRPLHGYGISQHIGRLSVDVLSVEQGSLYPPSNASGRAGSPRSGPRRPPAPGALLTITRAGRRQLGEEISALDTALLAINRVLRRA